jgi:hypothetical protein
MDFPSVFHLKDTPTMVNIKNQFQESSDLRIHLWIVRVPKFNQIMGSKEANDDEGFSKLFNVFTGEDIEWYAVHELGLFEKFVL